MSYILDTTYVTGSGYTSDQRVNLQTGINAAAGTGSTFVITQPYGLSINGSGVGLSIPSNTKVKFAKNGALRMLPHNLQSYDMIQVNGASNVAIYDAKLDGAKEMNAATTGEYGMGIAIRGTCDNVEAWNPEIVDVWGDALYVGSGNPTNIHIHNPNFYGWRRNGISVISCQSMDINGGRISGYGETNPRSGIDIEPNSNADNIHNLLINGITFEACLEGIGSYLQAMFGASAKTVDVHIRGCRFINIADMPLQFYGCDPAAGQVVSGNIKNASPTYIGCPNGAVTPYIDSSWKTTKVAITTTNATNVTN